MAEPAFSQFFSTSYSIARERLKKNATLLHTVPMNDSGPDGERLSIDCLRVGDPAKRVVLLTSGLHGVEGFYGSAVQLASAERLAQTLDGCSLILLHAINPYGFAWRRRWNEDNIDLNRNFLRAGEEYSGSPPLYAKLNRFLNPKSWRDRLLPYEVKAAAKILRYSHLQLQQTVPVGQYDFPQGLFFGGDRPAESHQVLSNHLAGWLDGAEQVIHLDMHTGLGAFGECAVLAEADADSTRADRLRRWFDNVKVNPVEGHDDRGTAYRSRGTLENWCLDRFASIDYEFATIEVGTYSMRRVLGTLRQENYRFWQQPRSDSAWQRALDKVEEAFVPKSPRWRDTVVQRTLRCVERAIEALK